MWVMFLPVCRMDSCSSVCSTLNLKLLFGPTCFLPTMPLKIPFSRFNTFGKLVIKIHFLEKRNSISWTFLKKFCHKKKLLTLDIFTHLMRNSKILLMTAKPSTSFVMLIICKLPADAVKTVKMVNTLMKSVHSILMIGQPGQNCRTTKDKKMFLRTHQHTVWAHRPQRSWL